MRKAINGGRHGHASVGMAPDLSATATIQPLFRHWKAASRSVNMEGDCCRSGGCERRSKRGMPHPHTTEPQMHEKSNLAGLVSGLILAMAVAARADDWGDLPFAEGPFRPTLQSLEQYRCPQWFRDAKFGIWAHWGPQAVPMDGDGYAGGIYQEGSKHYEHLLKNYGHPSKFGYKDIIALWKAEKWDPDRLMGLYKKAGARIS